ncbi:MAG: hypothetical protein CVV16_07615 [Gammaproteobacteria bacterium HGW-Gammaproteobacteria-6]|jgi:hypothetical protein|nr:MAG: hypothetical protein CVV16_07615 [Gammaproteobacteria bacterium HGW-Gammaproteobacteria-6]
MFAPLKQHCALIALSLVTVTSTTAGESHPCAPVNDAAERLACYDAAFPRPAGARPEPVVAEAARADSLQEFGLSREQLRKRDPERVREVLPDQLEAKVAGVDYRQTGERLITLESKQVWLLTEVTSKGQLRVGDPVVIRRAALGSFMLVTPGGVRLRARRVE